MTNYITQSFFDSILEDLNGARNTVARSLSHLPLLNVDEYEDRFEIALAIPGVDPNKVDVELEDKTLTISYKDEEKTEEEKEAEGCKIIRKEYQTNSFDRAITLPKNVSEESIKARSKNGVLRITVSKTEESKPKKLRIDIDK